MPTLPPAFWRLIFHADAIYDAASRRIRRPLGLLRPPALLPYRGLGTPARVLVKARVLESRFEPAEPEPRSLLGAAWASYKRYATRELGGIRVRAVWEDREWFGVTDEEGFLDLWVEPPPGTGDGWHEVILELAEAPPGAESQVQAPALVVGSEARFGVMSDLDDTVIVTGVRNLWRRTWSLWMTDHRVRLPFEGVNAFYAALRQGTADTAVNPIVYISSSPWNLYEHLDFFMRTHEIPFGPILLRDWGVRRDGFAPGGGHGHKLEKLRLVLDTLPDLPFLLIGDSGQEDAEHYAAIARDYPGRIVVIYIRKVPHRPGRERELERLAAEVAATGTAFLVVSTTEEAAQDAARRGLIRWAELEAIHEEREAELTAPTPLSPIQEE